MLPFGFLKKRVSRVCKAEESMKNDFNQHVLMLKFKSFSFGEDLSDTLLQIPICWHGIGTNVVGFGFNY